MFVQIRNYAFSENGVTTVVSFYVVARYVKYINGVVLK